MYTLPKPLTNFRPVLMLGEEAIYRLRSVTVRSGFCICHFELIFDVSRKTVHFIIIPKINCISAAQNNKIKFLNTPIFMISLYRLVSDVALLVVIVLHTLLALSHL